MGRNLKIEITTDQREELEKGYRQGKSHAFRQRCRIVLFKSEGKLSKEICDLVGIKSQNQVNQWVKRYKEGYTEQGLSILNNELGQGRKPTFDKEKDRERVRKAVKKERQRLSQAKLILEKEMDKSFHLKTLKRFLKNLSADVNEFASV
jgi:transposase